jgi:hypothetical protein
MDKNKLKEIIREIVDKVLAENAPAPAKPKEKPGPEVAPGKPDTGKPKPRRPLGNPTTAPKVSPKAEGLNEEEMLNKIVARFKSKNMNENAEQKYSYVKTHKNKDGKIVNILAAYPDSDGNFTKERINNISTKSKIDKWEIKFYKNKQEAESALKSKK